MNSLKKLIIFMIVSFKLLIYIINQTISNSSIITYLYLLTIVILSLPFLLKLKFDKKLFIRVAIISLISFMMFAIYKEDNIFLYTIAALITTDVKKEDIVKTFFYSGIIIYLFTLILGALNVLPISEVYRTIDGNSEIRTSLGFPNANAVFTYFVPIVLAGLYLYNKKLLYSVIMIIIATILYGSCKSRTGYYLTLIILIVNLLPKKIIIEKVGNKQFVLFTIISIIIAIFFGGSKHNVVNEILSGRPWYYLQFLKQSVFTWGFGVNNGLILDNLYLRLLANYSIIGYLLYLYVYTKGLSLSKDDKYLLFSSFFLLLYGVFEAVTVINFVIVILLSNIFEGIYEEN